MFPKRFKNHTEIKFNIVVFIAILITVLGGTTLLFQNDTFYTIKLGERILNEGLIPIDNFTMHEGLPYSYPHWLYTVIIYSIYKIGGYFGIYLSTVVFSYILGLIIYFTYLNLYKNLFISFLVAIMVISMLSANFTARAQLLTYILFALQIFFIEKTLQNGELKYSIFLIAISILIVNIHCATWILFFILFLPYFAEYIIAKFVKLDSTNLGYKLDRIILTKNNFTKNLLIIFIICLFTGLISPIGDTPYTYIYKTYQGISINYIMEHQPIVPISNIHFLIFVSTIAILCVFTKVKIRVSDIFMFSGLLLMTLMSLRQATILYIVCGYFLCRIATEFFENNNKERVNFYINKISTVKGGVIALIFVSLLSLNKVAALSKEYDSEYPVQATEYVLNNLDLDTIRIYTSYENGSYLLFHNIKVFIDSRADLYTIQFNKRDDIFSDYVDLYYINDRFRDVLAKYSFTHLLLNKNEKLYTILRTDPQYKEIYSDDRFVIYEALY